MATLSVYYTITTELKFVGFLYDTYRVIRYYYAIILGAKGNKANSSFTASSPEGLFVLKKY